MMRNLLITLRFDGSRYHGFQVQKNALSVCQVFQDAVESLFGVRWDVKGCSRTDSGVHAEMYCLSMRMDRDIPCEKLLFALNQRLPGDIAVSDVAEAGEEFHARYDCTGKQYTYRIHNSRIKDPFRPEQALQYPWRLDEAMLHREAQDFVGTHDFSAFCAAAGVTDDPVRTITAFSVERAGEEVLLRVEGDGFLYNMVRIMVGTLLHIAAGKLPKGSIPGILASRDRQRAGKTVPAKGLYLTRVDYADGIETC